MNTIKIRNSKKRLGRGYGSGKGGHTSSRGQKGQKARAKINVLFEGVKVKKSFVKRLPFIRGKAKFKAGLKPFTLNLDSFSDFSKKFKKVNLETLISSGLVAAKDVSRGVKILGKGQIKDKLTFELPVSKSAAEKIKKAGGEIVS